MQTGPEHTIRVCVGDEDGIDMTEAVFREPLHCRREEALPNVYHNSPRRGVSRGKRPILSESRSLALGSVLTSVVRRARGLLGRRMYCAISIRRQVHQLSDEGQTSAHPLILPAFRGECGETRPAGLCAWRGGQTVDVRQG